MDDKKNIILKFAFDEFSEKGFNGTTLSSISKKAGVNKALVHYYFNSKESLYHEVLQLIFGKHNTSSVSIYSRKWDITPPQKLYVALSFILSVHKEIKNMKAYRLYFWEMAEGTNYFKPFINEYIIPRMSIIFNIIEKGVMTGDFECDNPHMLVLTIFSTINSFEIQKDSYENTPWYDKLYSNYDNLVTFTINLVFKTLTPSDRLFKLPEIPEEISSFVTGLLLKVKSQDCLNFDNDLMNEFYELIT